jgi:acetolactate synthase-1/2/3 large subunit
VLVDLLARLGVDLAFGVPGGPIARFVHCVVVDPRIRWVTARTENGAVMEAIGAWQVTGRPPLITTTCGPGLAGTRQGLEIAASEGVHAIVVSPRTPAPQRGRRTPQDGRISADFLRAGEVFDLVAALEAPEELVPLAADLSAGLSGTSGFLAHIIVPSDLLSAPASSPRALRRRPSRLAVDAAVIDEVVEQLAADPYFILAGRGAHRDAELVRELAEMTGAPLVCTPGAKGVFDERGPNAVGVCGVGGHRDTVARLGPYRPARALVLGSRLSEASVTRELVALPPKGLIHVDRDAFAMGPAWDVDTLAVQSELAPFLEAVLGRGDRLPRRAIIDATPVVPATPEAGAGPPGLVRPRHLMVAVQRQVVDGSDAPVMVDVGTPWPWATSCLAFRSPRRFHLETMVGSMGLAVAGAVGAAIARRDKVVALTGDWSFDCQLPEVRTAVEQGAPVVWVVLQNFAGQMVIDGDREIHGFTSSSSTFVPADLAGAVRALAAGAMTVSSEDQLDAALRTAMASSGPYLVEVRVDTSELAPYSERFDALRRAQDAR